MDQLDDTDIRLSAQRSLWGNVPSTLRSASLEVSDAAISFRCYFDKGASEDDYELLRCAGTEVISDYPSEYTIDEQFIFLPWPERMTHLKHLVFLRHEAT
ncbi:hypothetical protein ACH518_06555 [Methylomonas sp. HW2-6]|uniref:hypothetical protein n=1 Tax=Methylomonas sp. HW2-6 TaxID=3376687 RepID=UPI00404161B0